MTPLLLLPGPVTVAPQVLAAASRPMFDHRSPAFAELLERIVAGLRPVFGTRSDVLAFGSSGTGGMEAAIVNAFSPGEVVLSCAVGAFGHRFAEIARRYGLVVETIDTPPGSALDPRALADRLDADTDRRIAGVLLTHNETSTGVQNDLAAIAPIVRRHGALTCVDSVSGLGACEFRMDEWGYDLVVTASQKALAAPPGVCAIAVSQRAWQAMERASVPRFFFDLRAAREFAAKGQTPFTPPIAAFAALDAALTLYHEGGGTAAAFERHARFARAVRAALTALGFELFSRPGAHSDTVVAARPPAGIEVEPLLRTLRERYGVVLSNGQGALAGKIVRFGTMGAIGENDLIGAVGALELGLHAIGAPPRFGAGTAAAIATLTTG